jgi:hypothetical protein
MGLAGVGASSSTNTQIREKDFVISSMNQEVNIQIQESNPL